MITIYALVAGAATLSADPQADLVARVERTELLANGRPVARVEKDAEGNVTLLRLDGMTLSAAEFTALGQMSTLHRLALNRTNVATGDLRRLQGLTRLEGLQLNSTELGDDAMAELVKLPALRSICLGNVAISPAAIDRLKADFESAGRRLALGYSPRNER